jgi:long-chain acyl-CoA synthetase
MPYSDVGSLAASPALRAHLDQHVASVNARLARFEQVKYYGIVAEEFTQENGLLTPTQKIRRKAVNARYREQFEALYAVTDSAPTLASAAMEADGTGG